MGKNDGKKKVGSGKVGGTSGYRGGGVARKCGGWQKWPGGVGSDGKFLLVKDACRKCGEISCRIASGLELNGLLYKSNYYPAFN